MRNGTLDGSIGDQGALPSDVADSCINPAKPQFEVPEALGATLVIGHRLADNPTAEDILGLHRNERSCLSCNPQFRTLLNLGSTPTSPLVTVPASVNATNHEHRVLAIA